MFWQVGQLIGGITESTLRLVSWKCRAKSNNLLVCLRMKGSHVMCRHPEFPEPIDCASLSPFPRIPFSHSIIVCHATLWVENINYIFHLGSSIFGEGTKAHVSTFKSIKDTISFLHLNSDPCLQRFSLMGSCQDLC